MSIFWAIVNLTLFGKRVFENVVKDLEMKRLSWIMGWVLNPMTSVFVRERGTERGEGPGMTETGGVRLEPGEAWGSQKLEEERSSFSPGACGGSVAH